MLVVNAFRHFPGVPPTSNWRGRILIGFVAVLAALLAAASFFANRSATERAVAETQRLHAFEVLSATDELKIATLGMVRGERGFVISGNPEYLEPYLASEPIARAELERLKVMLSDSPTQADYLKRVEDEFNHYADWSINVIESKQRSLKQDKAANIGLDEGRNSLETILGNLKKIEAQEQAILARHALKSNERASENERFQYLLSVIGIILIALSVIATIGLRRALKTEAATRAELHRLATTDDLTGVANRREFFRALEQSIELARERQQTLAIAIFDIDHFKRINDLFGHPAGDAVIRTIAALALDTVRANDIVSRIGGEEFALLLPECMPGDAYTVCERLRMVVAQANLELETGDAISVTVSTGLATLETKDDARSLIARADAALYEAKNKGRDRVLMAA